MGKGKCRGEEGELGHQAKREAGGSKGSYGGEVGGNVCQGRAVDHLLLVALRLQDQHMGSRWVGAKAVGEKGSGQRQKAEEEGAGGEKEQAAGGDGNGGCEGEGEESGTGVVGEARA